ncbi:DUF934 domain-containing protein [Arenicella xantha]|uniref:Uncharacterized protein (DUF934 family) n=1 Tax=Arenicella xantha TaxID=644221 RepID=A0A395JTB7_9GAMM|nr:DUF934 domain-containing protein [Arenicella xantha]RBP53736.1 uncharacterized protein (DUF934 family) [Arenicella xantha]
MVANRSIKARPKATPDRIQENIQTAQAILDHAIVDNDLLHIAETEELTIGDLPEGNISVPLNLWLENKDDLKRRSGVLAVQIAADEDPADLIDDLADISMIVLPFVSHVDGRSYTHASTLRKRYNYTGEIRAIGDVKFDQLGFLTRVGCNAFELPESENLSTALRAFSEFSEVYQPSADQSRLIFSRRRAIH